MGFGKSTPIPGGAKKDRAPATTTVAAEPNVENLQQWLATAGYLSYSRVTGVYDDATRKAVSDMADRLSSSQDSRDQQKAAILARLAGEDARELRRNPRGVAVALFQLQQIGGAASGKRDLSNTPFYEIDFGGGVKRLIPLALIRSRGYPMYQVILEQGGMLDMSKSVAERERQLSTVLDAIRSSLPEEEYSAILGMVIKADADLRQSWRGQAAGEQTSGSPDGALFATVLGDMNPEFASLPNNIKLSIMRALVGQYYNAAGKFLDNKTEITFNTKIKDMHAFNIERPSLEIDLRKKLQQFRGAR